MKPGGTHTNLIHYLKVSLQEHIRRYGENLRSIRIEAADESGIAAIDHVSIQKRLGSEYAHASELKDVVQRQGRLPQVAGTAPETDGSRRLTCLKLPKSPAWNAPMRSTKPMSNCASR